MAVSTCCMKCGGHAFEFAFFTPLGESRKLRIVQCVVCGVPLGIVDPVTELRMKFVEERVTAIDAGLKRIAKAL